MMNTTEIVNNILEDLITEKINNQSNILKRKEFVSKLEEELRGTPSLGTFASRAILKSKHLISSDKRGEYVIFITGESELSYENLIKHLEVFKEKVEKEVIGNEFVVKKIEDIELLSAYKDVIDQTETLISELDMKEEK